ncbi:uroporphyrinogen-III C-methyltransferase [Sphingobacterium populi]|uniref:uroporphyrinogen-III C-methyltransferase n=1 Tax=Sphingobacterium populi TaxID=1812824 RepID=A0ABW5UET5_9SPHI
MKDIKPFITLVGAGPGDAELITLKGIKAIREADVILYDALVNDELLEHAKPDCVKVYVGKRAERLSTSQDEINKLLVDYAMNYGHVVRLKGGDPFVFGRGGEELDYAHAHHIKTAVVPGISSSISLTGLQQIPLTYRHIAESFWVITGSKSDTQLSEDIQLAVKSTATVVILMGFAKLAEIASTYQREGKNTLPIAVIQNGSTNEERIVLGTIDTIVDQVRNAELGAPAIIVVGEVVAKHREFAAVMEQVEKKLLAV